jgi:hypothetical protein
VIGKMGRQIGTSIATEAGARAQAVRRSFTIRRPRKGWWSFLLWVLWVCLRGWIYIVAVMLLAGWWLYDQSPGEMLDLFRSMGAR